MAQMSDAAKLRQQRTRAHKRGDHRLCREEFCELHGRVIGTPSVPAGNTKRGRPPKLPQPSQQFAHPAPPGGASIVAGHWWDCPAAMGGACQTPAECNSLAVGQEQSNAPGEIETNVAAYVTAMNLLDGDPRTTLGAIAIALARKLDRGDAQAAAVRELRVLLAGLAETIGQEPGIVDAARLKHARRVLDTLIRNAGGVGGGVEQLSA